MLCIVQGNLVRTYGRYNEGDLSQPFWFSFSLHLNFNSTREIGHINNANSDHQSSGQNLWERWI